ncbi:acyltransferase family protein [Burkholderia territorii]|nr:acyltransferase [Burkholderia territorii]
MSSPIAKTADASTSRNFGLDLLRCVAVLLVLLRHTLDHGKPPEWLLAPFYNQGATGVEIFFVLSGFLIGHILIRSADAGKLHNLSDVSNFWKRRWARTLPAYAFFLVLYMRFDWHGPVDLAVAAPFFVFMQNFAWPMLPFFGHSWSLAVEEWFYLLVPIIFVISFRVSGSNRQAMLATCLIFFAVAMVSRILLGTHVSTYADVDRTVRSIVLPRIDSIMVGVLAAYVRIYHRSWFDALARQWVIPTTLFFGLIVYLAFGIHGTVAHPTVRYMLFPTISLIIAGVIPVSMRIESLGSAVLDRFIAATSKISYSLYLGHMCMLTLALGALERQQIQVDGTAPTFIFYAVLFIMYYAFATFTYRFVELPYIKLRDRLLGNSDERSGNVALASAREHHAGGVHETGSEKFVPSNRHM